MADLALIAAAAAKSGGASAGTTLSLGAVIVSAVAVLGAACIAAISATRRLKKQLNAEGERQTNQLRGEQDRLTKQLEAERVRSRAQLDAENERNRAQLAAERERLGIQLRGARVDELRAVLENAVLAFIQSSRALRIFLLSGDASALGDVNVHIAQLRANEARIAVRLGNDHDITATYSGAAEQWTEAVVLVAGPKHEQLDPEELKAQVAAAFNEAEGLSKLFIDHAAAFVGPSVD